MPIDAPLWFLTGSFGPILDPGVADRFPFRVQSGSSLTWSPWRHSGLFMSCSEDGPTQTSASDQNHKTTSYGEKSVLVRFCGSAAELAIRSGSDQAAGEPSCQ